MGIIKVTNDNYKELIEKSSTPILLDFFANWCGPCKMISPILEEVAIEKEGVVQVGKVDVDNERELASKFKVMSIPTLVLIKDGEVVQKLVGAQSKQTIINLLEKK